MEAFRRLFCAALCAGLLCGALTAAAHRFGTVPLILRAEKNEQAAKAVEPHEAADHAGMAAAWAPENGFERTAYTLVADLLNAIGCALLLAAGLALRGAEGGWREGLLWGLAGFAAFMLAPGLGLPPELPGAAAAPLLDRQLWWLATAAATAGGLALIAFARRPVWAVAAVILIVLPQLYGAPQPAEPASAASELLAPRFVETVTLTGFLSWSLLGASTGYFYRRFAPKA